MQDQSTSTVQDLWNRRLFQYLGTYLGLSFGLLQFMEFLVNRYQLDNSLVDKLFVFLLALLPAVAVLIYNHGRPGHDQWRPFEKVFIPSCLVIALTLSMVLFNDASANNVTEEISIATLDGKAETRMVPKVEFTKRFAIFPFENLSGKAEQDWMRTGLAYLLDVDMEQYMMNYVVHPMSMKDKYESFNAEFLSDIPFATQRKIAQEFYSDYFITGSFEAVKDNFRLSAKVHNTQNGQLFFEKEVEGRDLYDVVDQFSAALDKYLYLKDNMESLDIVDLPASNLVTADFEALQAYIEGLILAEEDARNVKLAIAKIEKSIELDPNCGTCFSQLAGLYFNASEEIKMKEANEKALTLADPLPERQRLMINFRYYAFDNNIEKAIILLDNWSQLYPHDYTPYSVLMSLHLQRMLWNKAEEVALRALENGHQGSLLYSLATIYISKQEFEKAEKYIDQYYALYPHKSKDKSLYEKIYSGRGELEKAKALYENALVMDPGDIDMLVKVGNLEDQLGNFSAGLSNLEKALAKSRTVQDSVKAYTGMESHFERLGQYEKSFSLAEKRKALMATYQSPPLLKQQFFFTQGIKMVLTGRKTTYFADLEDLKQLLPQNAPLFDCVGRYLYHMWAEELEAFEKYSEKCLEAYLLPMQGKQFLTLDLAAQAEMREDYVEAIKYYQNYIDSSGISNITFGAALAKVYRKNGDMEEALKQIDETLKLDPNLPSNLLEKSKIMNELGRQKEAVQLYEKTMNIWKEADEAFKPYQDALEYGRELTGAG